MEKNNTVHNKATDNSVCVLPDLPKSVISVVLLIMLTIYNYYNLELISAAIIDFTE